MSSSADKVYFYLDESHTTGIDSNCDGDNWGIDVDNDDEYDDDAYNDSDDGVRGNAPDNTYFSEKGGRATGVF